MSVFHLRHQVGLSVKASNLRRWFPQWTVARTAWKSALKPKVAGGATDAMLFSQHGARLVHRYWVYRDYVPHLSLRGTFMARLSDFTHRPVLRPARWPNVVGTPVPNLFRHLVVLRSRSSCLLTARRTMSLRPGRLQAPRCLQCCLMTPTFLVLRCQHLPAGVAATSAS